MRKLGKMRVVAEFRRDSAAAVKSQVDLRPLPILLRLRRVWLEKSLPDTTDLPARRVGKPIWNLIVCSINDRRVR